MNEEDDETFKDHDYIGIAAGTIIVLANIPQIYTLVTRLHSKDLNILFFSMILIGQVLWESFGICAGVKPLWIMNIFGILCTLTIICLIIYTRVKNKDKEPGEPMFPEFNFIRKIRDRIMKVENVSSENVELIKKE